MSAKTNASEPRYTFFVEWFDKQADLIRRSRAPLPRSQRETTFSGSESFLFEPDSYLKEYLLLVFTFLQHLTLPALRFQIPAVFLGLAGLRQYDSKCGIAAGLPREAAFVTHRLVLS